MYQIQNLTADARQKQTLVLPDGTQIVVSLYFVPMQLGWFLESLVYQNTTFELHGLRVCNSPNLLYQFRNLVPFGLAVISAHNREPMLQDDLLSQATRLFILTEAEVEAYTEYLTSG